MTASNTHTESRPIAPDARFAFVKSGWHAPIVEAALAGFKAEMARLGYPENCTDVFDVPGAFEIPLHAKMLARTAQYSGIIGCALVVDGGIYRHDFVAETVVSALMRVQLDTETPMISLVLTPHHFHESEDQQRFFEAHFVKKGAEAAQACAKTVESLARLATHGARRSSAPFSYKGTKAPRSEPADS